MVQTSLDICNNSSSDLEFYMLKKEPVKSQGAIYILYSKVYLTDHILTYYVRIELKILACIV